MHYPGKYDQDFLMNKVECKGLAMTRRWVGYSRVQECIHYDLSSSVQFTPNFNYGESGVTKGCMED